jgi:ribonuclease Z
VPLGRLRELVSVTPGQKIGYVVDAAHHPDNARRIVDLVRGADVLFVEAPFLQHDAEMAARKYHLTARQAGLLAREAGVKRLVPFHFSPRYAGEGERLQEEALEAFSS